MPGGRLHAVPGVQVGSPLVSTSMSWLERRRSKTNRRDPSGDGSDARMFGAGSVRLLVEGGGTVEDKTLLDQINDLAAEEHELFQKESRGEATEEDVERLRHLEVTLDQSWDLLHQRRARRDAGLDPDDAKVRDERTVEGYVN